MTQPDPAGHHDRRRDVAALHLHVARCPGGDGCTAVDDTDYRLAEDLLATLARVDAAGDRT